MYNNLFNVQDYVSDYVSMRSSKKPITSHPSNIELIEFIDDLPHYEIKSPQNLKNMAIRLDIT